MKSVLIFLILAMLPTISMADRYYLLMSKNDQLCQKVNRMFNSDLFHHKKVHLENHPEFNAFSWDKQFRFYNGRTGELIKKPRCDGRQSIGCKNAIFDINNDGQDELVKFTEEMTYGIENQNMMSFVLPKQDAPNDFYYSESYNVGRNITLKHLPVQRIVRDRKRYIFSSRFVLIRPFVVQKLTYVAIFFNSVDEDAPWSLDINEKNMVSIIQYDASNQPSDICYLFRTFKRSKKG